MNHQQYHKEVTGAEAVVLSLLDQGVDFLFGYPGGAIMPVYDALYDYTNKINHILVRHEQGAIHAAQGYARASKKTGVVLATSGPGATNLITGIADAQIDSTPLVCITGQVASHLLGTDAFQETDVVGISMPVTKWNVQVTSAQDIAPALAKAFYIASSGRPGPVLVDITKDAQFGKTVYTFEPCQKVRSYQPKPDLNPEAIRKAADLINQSKRPYILCGQGIKLSGAEHELMALAEKAQIPVASTLLGLSAFPSNHPLYVGFLGMHGNYGPNVLTNACDVLIAIGMRFDDRVTGDVSKYAKQATIIHIELDPSEINKIIEADLPVVGDAKQVLHDLLPLVEKAQHYDWLKEFERFHQLETERVIEPAVSPVIGSLKMAEVVHTLCHLTKGEAVVCTDVGQHQMITSRYYRFKSGGHYITSGGLGTMGFGLPASIGAKLAQPEKEVLCIVGDGGIQMTIQELGTIMQYKVGVKIMVLNNNFLGMVRQWQQLFFDRRYSFTEMHNPDFVTIARGYGIKSKKISERHELPGAMEEFLRSKESFLLEVVVENEENVFPMVATGSGVADMILNEA